MRVALGIEYDGSQYHGWQRQNEAIGVQQRLEEALSQIADEPIQVICAGRTDAGVHATGQIVHFEHTKPRVERAWTLGVNTILPDDIAVKWAVPVSDDFHARFSATARRYRYIICNQSMRGAILSQGVTHIHHPLDEKSMQLAANCLLGTHDFTAFRAVQCQAHSPVRTITNIELQRFGDYLVLDVQANAFLHHMVRNIVGSLIVIGKGEQPVEWMQQLLDGKDRTKSGATAKPNGLYLVHVTYPEEHALPHTFLGPLFLPLKDF
ncbi:tRNA pseudouridine(38-40) synthase TruA [Neptunicella marina]|uniref:tRNA pseudouridine synthase A n=1 Tax=Neptunicella marina TaxID=2125989 RepID=A0A8J6IU65_9ALTE|nr:tRNA pseudouridine(38-40) synthase TruA [Neptunicella marina]MBC3766756.1 tRNA pseudouridine(38-40) synthase TruA [Neptunicella marina]